MDAGKNEIQKEIIEILIKHQPCAFGDIVKALRYSYNDVLNNVIELKKNGEIQKLNKHNANYTLTYFKAGN